MTRKYKRYSEGFKRQVVSEYEAGHSILGLMKMHGITGGDTITNWIRKYGKAGFRHETVYIQTAAEIERVKELEKQIKELQQALGRVTLEKLKLESILETMQVEEQLVKKNDRPSSSGSGKKPSETEST
jgi:transposase